MGVESATVVVVGVAVVVFFVVAAADKTAAQLSCWSRNGCDEAVLPCPEPPISVMSFGRETIPGRSGCDTKSPESVLVCKSKSRPRRKPTDAC